LAKLEPLVAGNFVSHVGEISFRGIKTIDQSVAKELLKCECKVYLMGLEAIDDQTALALTQFGGSGLWMNAGVLEQCSEDVRRKLQENERVVLVRAVAD
jgi:hypothetical protein